ncbi:MAG: glycosyltransferase [Oscillospiraceae bacterium]|nr:glycosyltransferase [Oscillospiraceae bacterium]
MKIGLISFAHLLDWTGITRLIDQIAAEMVKRGHSVTIIAKEGKASSKIPTSALAYKHELLTLNLDTDSGRKQAREKIANSGLDVCAASVGGTEILYLPWLFKNTNIPFVHGEAADPRVFVYERWEPYEHFGVLSCAAAFTVLLEEYLPFYPQVLRKKARVIGNPAPPPADIDFKARREKKTRTIIAVGRFNEDDKRFSMLLRAFALLHNEFPDWRVKLVGDGPFMQYYEIMATKLGIKRLVEFTGSVSDVSTHYKTADIFCLPSFRAEGLPMVFLEASAHALPLVGYSSCAASAALITPEIGALAKNTPGLELEVLAKALSSLMTLTPQDREKIGILCLNTFQKKYANNIIFDQWETLLVQVSNKEVPKNMLMQEWPGLEPDSPVWTEKLLTAAGNEIAERALPLVSPETSSADEETECVRLRSKLARIECDYKQLEKKYAELLRQFQALAGKTHKKIKPR